MWVGVITLIFAITYPQGAEAKARERRPGHILYQLKKGIGTSQRLQAQSILSRWNFSNKKTLSFLDGTRVQLAAVEMGKRTEEEIAQELVATGAVEYAEPDYKVYPVGQPNDPLVSKQWHHETLHTFRAWEITTGKPTLSVTVCDTGVDANHVDLRGNVILPGYNTVDGSTRSSPVNIHGTAVSGLIAAKANNRIGVSGIAPSAKILPVRVTNDSAGSAYLSDLAECVRYGADHGAKVHNVSFTGSESRTIDAAAKYARDKGSLLFMAAGNQGVDISSTNPNYPSFVLVGGTTQYDKRASFSNYGTPIDIVAPGVTVYTTAPKNSYTTISGTSFSSPIAAAVGALIYSVNSEFTPTDVEQILFQSSDYIGSESLFGYGRVNAEGAVALAQKWVKR
jgi:subtilisin family serine protease